MSRLPRPHIPLDIRCRVAMRQLGYEASLIDYNILEMKGHYKTYLTMHLAWIARQLKCDVKQLHLDHDPALENRRQIHSANATVLSNETFIRYDPDANDPKYLIYRVGGFTGSEHDIKTRVRGEHGQLSDHGLARKAKRRQRKLTKPKTKWSKGRKLQSRNTFRRSK